MPVHYAKLLFWVAAACCVVSHAAILRSVLRTASTYRAPSRGRRLMEIAWAVVPALVLAAVLVTTWRGIRSRS